MVPEKIPMEIVQTIIHKSIVKLKTHCVLHLHPIEGHAQ